MKKIVFTDQTVMGLMVFSLLLVSIVFLVLFLVSYSFDDLMYSSWFGVPGFLFLGLFGDDGMIEN